jgi:hypothetical protein
MPTVEGDLCGRNKLELEIQKREAEACLSRSDFEIRPKM